MVMDAKSAASYSGAGGFDGVDSHPSLIVMSSSVEMIYRPSLDSRVPGDFQWCMSSLLSTVLNCTP